ncbi:MAG: type III secretion system chaperone [Desulfovibrionaceae bacterium]|nr:type III secretion system chaperone [Desulfovibrionaceae bacterium]
MTRDDFSPVLQAFGSSLGIEGLALDEYQSCTLTIDEVMLAMQWKSEAQTVLIYAPVGMIDQDNLDKNLLVQLLEANCLGLGTGGLALGLQPGLGAIILSGQLSTHNLEPVVLERFIEFFTNMADEWKGRLAQTQAGLETAPDTPAAPDMPVGIRI